MSDLYLDVDGTLIDQNDNIRPFVKELFITAISKGYSIFVWSAGGIDYAKRQLERIYHKLDMNTTVTIVSKDFKSVRYTDKRSVCIDDMNDVCLLFRAFKGLGYKVPFYDATCLPKDQELKRIMELL